MVQSLISAARRLRTEQQSNLAEIQRLRSEPSPTPSTPKTALAVRKSSTQELTNLQCLQATRACGETGVSSCVPTVVDLHLVKLMEEAELAARANVWQPSTTVGQDMDVQLGYLLVMLTSGLCTLDHPTTAEWSTRIPRPCSHTTRVRKHLPWRKDPAGVTDRLGRTRDLKWRDAGGYKSKCAVLLERVPSELRTHLLLTCGTHPDFIHCRRQTVESCSVARRSCQPSQPTSIGDALNGDKVRKGKHVKGKKGKAKGKGKHKGKQDISPK